MVQRRHDRHRVQRRRQRRTSLGVGTRDAWGLLVPWLSVIQRFSQLSPDECLPLPLSRATDEAGPRGRGAETAFALLYFEPLIKPKCRLPRTDNKALDDPGAGDRFGALATVRRASRCEPVPPSPRFLLRAEAGHRRRSGTPIARRSGAGSARWLGPPPWLVAVGRGGGSGYRGASRGDDEAGQLPESLLPALLPYFIRD